MRRSKWVLIGLLAAGFVAVTLVLVLVAWQFIRYRGTDGEPPEVLPPPSVRIVQPAPGNTSTIAEVVNVNVNAVGPADFLSMELWINGELAAVQAAPAGGQNPWTAPFSWIPDEAGAYSLLARGFDADGLSYYSDGVVIGVEATSLDDGDGNVSLAANSGDDNYQITYPGASIGGAAVPLYVPPQAPDGESSQSGAQDWNGSPGDWITSLTASAVPTAPDLSVESLACAAMLSIHDLSDNEEGFILYRQDANASSWTQVATLAAQTASEWITYSDSGLTGGVTYYVSAFNSQGKSNSNPVVVAATAQDCAQSDGSGGFSAARLQSFESDLKTDRNYCYYSFNGGQSKRWPEVGFLEQNAERTTLGETIPLPHDVSIDSKRVYESLDLYLECWGWSGETLFLLGEGYLGGLGDMTGPVDMFGDNFSLTFILSDLTKFNFPLGPLAELDGHPLADTMTLIDPPTALRMPYMGTKITDDPAECGSHLEPTSQNLLGQLFLCAPYPNFNIGPGGALPQQYVVWAPLDNVCDAKPAQDCVPYQSWKNFASSYGGEVWFQVRARNYGSSNPSTSVFSITSVTEPDRMVLPLPPINPHKLALPEFCHGPYPMLAFDVRMLVTGQAGLEAAEMDKVPQGLPGTFIGPWGNPQILPCDQLGVYSADLVPIKVTFESIKLTNTHDGCCGSELDLYGSMGVNVNGEGNYEAATVFGFPQPGNTVQVDSGTYSLANWSMCLLYDVYFSDEVWPCDNPSNWSQNNNSVEVLVYNQDAIEIFVHITDDDWSYAGNQDDTLCLKTVMTPNKTIQEWALTESETYVLSSPNKGSGACQVTVTVNSLVEQ